jgi:hypothetical protein
VRPPASLLLLALLALAAAAAVDAMTAPKPVPAIELPGRPAPELARLFTPRSVPASTYQVSTLDGGVDRALARVRDSLPAGVRLGTPPGAWEPKPFDPLEAFGRAGEYDRAKVAQLYLGREVVVASGPIERDGRTVGALTLFSPYPDPSLSRLEAGTLAILMRRGR